MTETPDVFTPLDVERQYRIPRSTQTKARASGLFAPHFKVGRRVYYLKTTFQGWIAGLQTAPARDLEHPEGLS